ncbi:three-helix bundle dimerization domain-containing protein [Nocardia sp. NPDC101769]|uniref:three-helix bundle dimerization domain-containing protein n=1 Tax=Nocardia sp. NPDC101769 TaxID=3364333 RepID=UPI00381CBCD4
MTESDEEQQMSDLAARLSNRFPDLTARVVGEVVRGIHRDFEGHRVREFIPLLVERIAERQLSRRVCYSSAVRVDR